MDADVPLVHVSDALACSGVSLPVHEKPMTEAPHCTVVSWVHVLVLDAAT